jgi:hypothetical protein
MPMQVAQFVEVKGDISLESVQVYPGSGSMGFPQMMGGNMGFMPSQPPPPQPSFGGDFNAGGGFGFPSAPPAFSVRIHDFVRLCDANKSVSNRF